MGRYQGSSTAPVTRPSTLSRQELMIIFAMRDSIVLLAMMDYARCLPY